MTRFSPIAALLLVLIGAAGCAQLRPDAHGQTEVRPAAQSFDAATHLVATVRLGPDAEASADRLAADFGMRLVAAWPLKAIDEMCFVFQVDPRRLGGVLDALRAHPDVIEAQNVHTHRVSSSEERTEEGSLAALQTHLEAMNAAGAHRLATGRGVRVAIVDTGLDHRHPDLAAAIEFQRDFVEDGRDGARERHGTAVAGVIGARGRTRGVAFETRLGSLRSCWERPEDWTGECNTLSLARALNYAVSAEIDVVNMSIAGPHDPLLARLIDAFVRSGGIVIAARDARRRNAFPASHPAVIAARPIESAGEDDAIPAPARDVLSTAPGETYDYYSGASIASAQITGVVALMRELDPTLSAEEARAFLAGAVRGRAVAPTIDACRVVAKAAVRDDCP